MLKATHKIEEAIATLDQQGLIYRGILEPPKGKKPDDWEEREQTLFKSSEFGDDIDRAIKKSDGSWTYFAPDIAYHFDKIERGYDLLIDLFGIDTGSCQGFGDGFAYTVLQLFTVTGDGGVAHADFASLMRQYSTVLPQRDASIGSTSINSDDMSHVK